MERVDVTAGSDRLRSIGRRLEGWALALALAAGGAVVGFAFSEWRLHEVIVDLRTAHKDEVGRLTELCVKNISALAPKVEQAAQTASTAAATANGAARTANTAAAAAADAADTSAGAAKTARSAAVSIARRSSVAALPPDVSQAVEQANRKVKEAHR